MTINISSNAIADLRKRLANTRWPEPETVDDWSQGVPLNDIESLCADWENHDWRKVEEKINSLGSSFANIQGLNLHYLHIRSNVENATPLLLIHGWPGSILEFVDAAPLLTTNSSGEPAFDLVIPALPGYGFSEKPANPGIGIEKIASMLNELMTTLGYQRYIAQGGDWGSAIALLAAENHSDNCIGAHINMITAVPPAEVLEAPTTEEKNALARFQEVQEKYQGYLRQQSTMPQTLSYGLTDSPAGQAAWIYEKFYYWTDNTGKPESAISRERILDNISLYWFTATAGSSAKLYWESIPNFVAGTITAPVACSVFPEEIIAPSKRWAEGRLKNIVYWNETPKGGHFAAMEQPELFAVEVRNGAKALLNNT